ncbi:MAG TPA: hypothetical protein VHD90_07485 [Phototrophicaceae bacterium]|nr:hypothetical protein [Phototrophicaceae bacterium]
MKTTLKHIDVGAAFRVGAVLYGLLAAVFGLILVLFESLVINSLTNLAGTNNYSYGNVPFYSSANLLGAGILGALCFYGVGIVTAAIGGGISLAIVAVFYNLTARWVGGLRLELQADDSLLLDDIERDLRPSRPNDRPV